ncbi:MAG: hypothetical protein NTX64_14390 [Elusimicrobia bacterium]|nr:hypothetical protein [Elusimicrobiota bacterium]
MKTILALCAAVLIGAAVFAYRETRMPDEYGTVTGAPQAAVADLIARPKDFLKKTVAVEGVIREQCETMGCYFFFHDGNNILRVDLQEIAMNAPRRNGHPARVEGQLVKYGDGYQLYASAVRFE